VVRKKEGAYVYVVRDGKAYLTPIEVSYSSGETIEIGTGLRASDPIVVDPRGLEGDVVPVEVKKTP
jgi:multidrug efflux pump subunit AcrA (membrane-fusion protein)